ncbi:MAG TPA: multicopper oxidase domain-containing protein, partial [Propionibacteriaceae bacterium]|nr:multicopper oxidase domain-containing protein [Propionibacteriaceae bacterium]
MTFSRRDMLRLGGLAAVGTVGAALPLGGVSGKSASSLDERKMPVPFRAAFKRLEVLKPAVGNDADGPIHYYDISATQGTAQIIPGMTTPVMGYEGRVPGRRIDVNKGTRIVMTMRNRLPKVHPNFGTPMHISTHLHGSASLPQYDGYASDVTLPGQKKYYHYPNFQPARTLWYHDHGIHYTAQNAYSGLAAQYHLHDAMERALLPQGEFDVALTLSDAMFDGKGALQYD